MKFDNNAPEWSNPGSEPSEDIQARGFYAGYKPPANIFNWFWYKVGKCIKELQDKLSNQDDNKVDKKQYASITEAGVIKLYSGNNTNRSGLVVDAETGVTYVNTKAERGITRDGAGQIGIVAATTDEINAKEQEYKPITPKNLDYAAGIATPDITTSNTLTEIASGDKNSVILGKVQKAISELIKLINLKGETNGFAELDENGLVPSSQLPSYVDDVIECDGISNFPNTGESGKIYVDKVTNRTYRWSGTQYTEISESLAIGETSSTAYRGDRGKIAYEHSQLPHAPTTTATQSAAGLMSSTDKTKLDGVEIGAQAHKAPTNAEIISALGYTPARSSHNHTISDITGLSSELKVTLGDNLELIDATGRASFYHFTLAGWTEGESHILTNVSTTFGEATFGESHGLPNYAQNSTTDIYVYLYIKNGVVMWDEWYNGYDADYGGDTMFDIGEYTADYDRSTGNEGFYVSYVNDNAGAEITYSLNEAIIELANRISVIRSMS